MKKLIIILFLTLFSCSSGDDNSQIIGFLATKESLFGNWKIFKRTVNNSNGRIKGETYNLFSIGRMRYSENNDTNVLYGSWTLNENLMTITWDKKELGVSVYNITLLDKHYLEWATIIGKDRYVEKFLRQN